VVGTASTRSAGRLLKCARTQATFIRRRGQCRVHPTTRVQRVRRTLRRSARFKAARSTARALRCVTAVAAAARFRTAGRCTRLARCAVVAALSTRSADRRHPSAPRRPRFGTTSSSCRFSRQVLCTAAGSTVPTRLFRPATRGRAMRPFRACRPMRPTAGSCTPQDPSVAVVE